MTLRSRRKHQTTRPSSRPWKSIDLVAAVAVGLIGTNPALLIANDFGWGGGRLPAHAELVDQEFDVVETAPNDFSGDGDLSSNSAEMAAAWEEDDALAAELETGPEQAAPQDLKEPESPTRSVITKRSIAPPDPFDSDDRYAQLPNDPFDEPSGETIPELEEQPNLDAVENALDREMERREAEVEERAGETDDFDLIDEPTTEEDMTDAGTEPSQVGQESPQSDLEFNLQTPERPQSEVIEPLRRGIGTTPSEEAAQSQQSCEEELAALKADRISTVDLSIRIDGVPGEDFPYECPLGDDTLQPRVWPEITYTWKASALCHKPLYYEDVQLERYGHSWPRCVQPLVSGAHFFGSTAILPYKMGLQTPNECVYALGHYRPGSCAPYYIEALPFTWRAAAFQAGAVTGIHFALP